MDWARCHNVEDLRRAAQRRLPAPLFHYIDGGADDEWTLRRNTAAFEHWALQPQVLRDVSAIDLRTRVLGCDLDLPFFLAPTGMSRLFHHDKELGAARAAQAFGTLYSLSTLATTRLEDVAQVPGPKMFQVYIHRDRGLTLEFVQRCKAAGYAALCLTVDTPLGGNRERDLRTGMVMPPKFTWRSLASFAASPHWTYHWLRDPDFGLANVRHSVDALAGGSLGVIEYLNSQLDRSVSWQDAEWLRAQWDGPLAIKGIITPADAVRAQRIGASAVMISNHGGRQLDTAPAPIEMLPAIRDAVGAGLELIVDGGVRRGTHVLKALALGATACSIGRGYLYGLAAAGRAGVERALQLLRTEVARDMALLGCTRIDEIGAAQIKQLDQGVSGT